VPDDENSAPQAVGIIDGQGRGNKRSPGIALNGVTRRMLEDSLTGYLSEFEALYQAGEIKDHHMFPAVALNRALPSRLRSRPRCRRSRSTRWKSFGGRAAQLEAKRAARREASERAPNTINPGEETDLMVPAVDRNAKARVHAEDPGFATTDSTATY
jgi:hypothetical protein